MVVLRDWDGPPAPQFAALWRSMLEECGLVGTGLVSDWEERLRAHFVAEFESGRMQWFVAEDGGVIVGTAAAILHGGGAAITKDRYATLAGIYVVGAYRRRGIARALTERAIAWCVEQECSAIRLRASQAARPLYESLGFEPGTEMVLAVPSRVTSATQPRSEPRS